MRMVRINFIVLIGLLALAYWAGRQGFGTGVTAQLGVAARGGGGARAGE